MFVQYSANPDTMTNPKNLIHALMHFLGLNQSCRTGYNSSESIGGYVQNLYSSYTTWSSVKIFLVPSM